jgi:hypothetical protein
MEYVKLGNSDLRVSRICLGCMGFGDPTIGQHAWTIGEEPTREIIRRSLDLHLTAEDIAYLEEPYVPHNLSGVMAVNKPIMSEDPVWVTARRSLPNRRTV